MSNLLVSIAEVRLSEYVFARTLLILDSFLDSFLDRTNRFSFCLRPATGCQQAGGYCIRSFRLCKEGSRPCPKFEGCPDQLKCCWYVSHSRRNNFYNRDSQTSLELQIVSLSPIQFPQNSELRLQNYLFGYIEELNYLLSTTSGLVLILARGY